MDDQNVRVLLIDDDEDDYFLTRDLFNEIAGGGYTLEWASSYEDGLEGMCRGEYDVYLLDYRLGARTGLELLREATATGCARPAILLTGQGEREIDLQAMQAGAIDYLEKGWLDAALLERSIRYARTHWNYQAELERRVEERTAELTRANEALRQSEDRLRRALVDAPVPVMLLDDGEQILLLSKTWLRITGYREEDIRTLTDWTSRAYREQSDEALAHFRQLIASRSDRDHAEFAVWTSNGTVREWTFATSALGTTADGRELFVLMANDVTERNEAERGLHEADKRKDEFLAVLAHELRNPLAPIRTGLEALRIAGDDTAMRDEIRSMMERQTQQMARLIDDLLDVSRITRGKMELRTGRVELSEVIKTAVEATQPFIDEGEHGLVVSLPEESIKLDVDPARIAQVISNLLHNAAKYTTTKGTIWLTAEHTENEVAIRVRDNGLGIPREMLLQIFEMFAQIDRSQETGYTGLGIGLTLVKSLVEMHGGRIEVASEGAGHGSEFTVWLSIAEAATEETPPANGSDAGAESGETFRRRLLIVDDNEAAAKMMSMLVRMLGNEVQTAYNGLEAIEAAESFRPDVVFMDLGMPKLNGYDAARRIRSETWGKRMVLVALTGWGQDEDRRRTREAGFDHHLVKPVEPDTLRKLFTDLHLSVS